MNTKDKGTKTEVKCLAFLVDTFDEVYLPFGDRMPHDMVFLHEGKLWKVQCKFTSHINPAGSYQFHLSVSGGNRSSGSRKTFYEDGDFDYLFVECGNNDQYFIPWGEISHLKTLTIGSKIDYSGYKIN